MAIPNMSKIIHKDNWKYLDVHDHVYANYEDEEAIQVWIKRSLEWIAKQPEETQRLFCEHGVYVGYQRALAYYCPRCPEE